MSVKSLLRDVDADMSSFERARGGEDLMYSVPYYTGSASSDAIYASNADAIFARLEAIDPAHVCQHDDGSVWIKLYSDWQRFSDAAKECVKIDRELRDYALLDEDLYSERRDAWCENCVDEYVDQARELIEGGDVKAIDAASEITVDAQDLIDAKDREAAVHHLALALAETDFIA